MAEIPHEIALRCMSPDLTDNKSTLVQVMAWCHQASSHYLSQCWPRSMLPHGITRLHCVKSCGAECNTNRYMYIPGLCGQGIPIGLFVCFIFFTDILKFASQNLCTECYECIYPTRFLLLVVIDKYSALPNKHTIMLINFCKIGNAVLLLLWAVW